VIDHDNRYQQTYHWVRTLRCTIGFLLKSLLIIRLTACLLALLLVGVSVPSGAHAGIDSGHSAMNMEDCNDGDVLASHANHCCLVQISLGASTPVLSKPIDYVQQATIEPEERHSGTLPNPLLRPPQFIG